jgi:aminoglycoside phosphotransferase (APT) family kinase protein
MMHDGEIIADPAVVGRLLAAQFPQWADLPLKPVPSAGTDNAIYRLGSDMVVRLPRVEWAVAQVEKEQQWLPRLAPHLPLSVPLPLGSGVPAEDYPWPWSIYRWLDGDNATIDRMADPCEVAVSLAHFITALHGIDATGGPAPGPHNFGRGVPLAARDAATRQAIAALTGLIDIDAAGAAWQEALQTPGWHDRPVWIHGDLMPGNLLLSHGRLTGVIDFGGLGVGDPACDLIVAWNLFRGASRKAFRDALTVDDATWVRGRGWALSVALIQLPYYLTTNPVIAANARHVIAEVLADRRTAGDALPPR